MVINISINSCLTTLIPLLLSFNIPFNSIYPFTFFH